MSHPYVPADVTGLFDLRFPLVENSLQKSSSQIKKGRDWKTYATGERLQQEWFQKTDNNRTYHQEIQNSE